MRASAPRVGFRQAALTAPVPREPAEGEATAGGIPVGQIEIHGRAYPSTPRLPREAEGELRAREAHCFSKPYSLDKQLLRARTHR